MLCLLWHRGRGQQINCRRMRSDAAPAKHDSDTHVRPRRGEHRINPFQFRMDVARRPSRQPRPRHALVETIGIGIRPDNDLLRRETTLIEDSACFGGLQRGGEITLL